MRKTRYQRWHRQPKTTAEKRANQDGEYVRAARSPANLPSWYDDIPVGRQKSWKKKREKQFRDITRGARHSLTFQATNHYWYKNSAPWKLKEYFESHDIPFNVEWHYEVEFYYHPIYENRRTGKIIPVYSYAYPPERRHQCGWSWEYERVFTGNYQRHKSRKTVGVTITWWSDKNIGIEYILTEAELASVV